MRYLRYFGTQVLLAATIFGLFAGGGWYWSGLAVGFAFWIAPDALSRPVAAERQTYRHPRVLDLALYGLMPSLLVMSFAFAWAHSPGDLLGVGAMLTNLTGYDLVAARAAATLPDHLGACLSFGLAMAMGGILTAHELGHRTADPVAMWTARWMLALAFNSSLEVAHVYGHHRDVGTAADPATARRGESIYHFYVRSTVGQFFQAWRLERDRLAGSSSFEFWSRSKVVRGVLRSGVVALIYFLAGGWFALGAFLLASMWNKFLLESLNYAEHYGLVRAPGTPVEPRHAWDSVSAFSHAALFNLPWHADHHARAGVQYPDLVASTDAPVLGRGYLATLPLIWVPPLWFRLIGPRLADWDQRRASDAERQLIASA
ncbi:MAG: alkane 1-monooxygenase [Gammaproteobacteria bacterium]